MKVHELFAVGKDIEKIASEQGFTIFTKKVTISSKRKDVTLLTKDETVDGTPIVLHYEINPETSAWVFRASRSDQDDFVDFHDGEDFSSLIHHLKRKKKLTSSQIADYLTA